MANDVDALFAHRGGTQASDASLSRISQLIAEEDDVEREIETAIEMLASAKERKRELLHVRIPQAMLDCGIREFTTDNDLKAKVVFMTDGSLGSPKNEEERAEKERKLDCIIDHGGGEIVKQMIVIEFPKEAIKYAEEIKSRLVKLFTETKKWSKINPSITRERSVNHQTLGSWVREKMSSDRAEDQLPPTFFEATGLWYGEGVKITRPKKGKQNGTGS